MRKVADSLPMYCRDCGKWLAVGERDLCRPCAKDRQEDAELEAYLEYRDIECECKSCATLEIDRADN